MAGNLPPEIIADILACLSVKDLLRYRSVAKPWCCLIDSPEFTRMHLEHAMKASSGLGVVTTKDIDLYWIYLDRTKTAKKLHKPSVEYGTNLVGSCNGLIALCEYGDLTIWNPSTRRYRMVPGSEVENPRSLDFSTCYGFGYNRIADDYQLVRVFVDERGAFESQVKVYSAKTDRWKRVQDFPYFLRDGCEMGALTNNALHWIVSRTPEASDTKFIVAFDLEKEEFREVPMPSFRDREIHLNAGVLGGLLCLTCNFPKSVPNHDGWGNQSNGVDVWVMKEYGVKESWTKVLSVVPNEHVDLFSYISPVANLSEDRILLDKNGEKFIMYDLKGGWAKAKSFYSTSFMEWLVCVESLVGLDGRGGSDGWKTRVQKTKRRRTGKETKHDKERRDDYRSQGFKLVS